MFRADRKCGAFQVQARVCSLSQEFVMDQRFGKAYYDFAASLLREAFSGASDVMLSPLSVSLALAMCAGGADGSTQQEILKAVGGGMPYLDYSQMLQAYAHSLPTCENASFHFADAIWFREDLNIKKLFKVENERLYDAEIESVPFDDETKSRINAWVCEKTNGMIPEIVDHLSPFSRMVLVNALAFEAKWADPYEEYSIHPHIFTGLQGETKEITGMFSSEKVSFFAQDAKGFVKPYAGGAYSFIAILPDEDLDFSEYLQNLTGEKLLSYLSCFERTEVDTMIPKFMLDYAVLLNSTLKRLGIMAAFSDAADFNKISNTPLKIGEVLHKTHIEVDESGTKAAAATAVFMRTLEAAEPEPTPTVYLDRPFIYMITDNQRALPIFIGAISSPEPLEDYEEHGDQLEL